MQLVVFSWCFPQKSYAGSVFYDDPKWALTSANREMATLEKIFLEDVSLEEYWSSHLGRILKEAKRNCMKLLDTTILFLN